MTAPILPPDRIAEAARLLQSGALVAFPTDTVYGVAAVADAAFDNARLRAFKGGRQEQFSLHAGSLDALLRFGGGLNAAESFATARLAPRGVTVVAARDGGSLGLRLVQHEVGSALLEAVGAPVVATSANVHGQPPLNDPAAIAELDVDAVLDGGMLPERPASSVVRLLPCGLEILREGALPRGVLCAVFTRGLQFVCLGNLNRSAFAHGLIAAMQAWLAGRVKSFVPAFEVSSSGLIARPESRPPAEMQRVAQSHGVDLGAHKPTRFNAASRPALCVSMGADVLPKVEAAAPAELLRWEITDPMGKPRDAYVRCAQEVIDCIRRDLLARWAGGGEPAAEFARQFS